ncbi:preprotein translocase subunit SecG [Tepidicaulis sp. LMO-SS28]|uniref:preprotein translocase subunit SecG n=1 Tax=Tepidicaulis sp. LMO-SS28 TaxID=3447455 RepID=UPI003EDEF38F
MATILLVVHLLIAISLVVTVLLQRSEGGALGIGGGGGGMMTGRGAANMLTRSTAILAALFFATSIALTLLAQSQRAPSSILDTIEAPGADAPIEAPETPAPVLPGAEGEGAETPAPPTSDAPQVPSAD